MKRIAIFRPKVWKGGPLLGTVRTWWQRHSTFMSSEEIFKSSEMDWMVINVTFCKWWQEKVTKTHRCREVRTDQCNCNETQSYVACIILHFSDNGFYTFQFRTHLCLQFPVLLRTTISDKQKRKDRLALFGTFVPGQRHNLRFLHYLPPLASHGRSRFLRAPSPIASTPKLVRNVLTQLFICWSLMVRSLPPLSKQYLI